MNLEKGIFRAWYYFRQGYATYLAFAVGVISNIITIYALGIKPTIASGGNVGDFLETVFPHLTNFIIIALVVATPLCIYLGLLHMRRTGAFEADAAVATESNPYVYRIVPGKEQEVFLPLWLLTTRWLAKILELQNNLTVEEKNQFKQVLTKADELLGGRSVGAPERLGLLSIGRPRKKEES